MNPNWQDERANIEALTAELDARGSAFLVTLVVGCSLSAVFGFIFASWLWLHA